jgi:3-oxoadipate enol-lactonase
MRETPLPTTAPSHRVLTSDGASISYTHHPAPFPAAPRVVLIHSLALDRHVWDGVVALAGQDAEIITMDCRGHGQSARDAAVPFTAELFARDLAELLDHAGWETATIGGCSMGGCVAMAFAGLYPDRATALLLVDTTAWYGPAAPQQFRGRAEAARLGGMAGLVGFQIGRWFSDSFRARRPDLVERYTRIFLDNDFECYARSCALLGDADLRAYLPGFRMPVSLLVGEQDQATPPVMAEALHAAIPQSTITVLPGARHLTPIECPEQVAAALRSLVRAA